MAFALVAGCKPTIVGWWDLDRWEIERGGDSISREDAGFAVWAPADQGGFELLLRYDYDPDAFDLVPIADAPLYGGDFDADEFDADEPLVLGFGDDERWYQPSFEIEALRTTRMVLQAASPVAGEDATWTWTLSR